MHNLFDCFNHFLQVYSKENFLFYGQSFIIFCHKMWGVAPMTALKAHCENRLFEKSVHLLAVLPAKQAFPRNSGKPLRRALNDS